MCRPDLCGAWQAQQWPAEQRAAGVALTASQQYTQRAYLNMDSLHQQQLRSRAWQAKSLSTPAGGCCPLEQVEQMVRMKMEQKEYIILCLEDSNDWSNATTRRLVMQVGRPAGWCCAARQS